MQAPLDPRLLETFVRAAHSGSLSATALQIGRTQSAVTMQMQRLEEILGQSLLRRSGSGVRLTGAGERFLVHAERILKTHEEALEAFSDRRLRGSIVFGSPEDYLLTFFPSLLKSFGARYPDVEIKVVAAPTVELRVLLHSRQVDLALISTRDQEGADDIVRTESLAWVGAKPRLKQYGFGDVIPLALPASNAVDHRAACDAMARAGLRYKVAYASNSIAGLIAVARSGLAISVMTRGPVPADLFVLKAPLPAMERLGVKLALAKKDPTPAIAAFADHIRRTLPSL